MEGICVNMALIRFIVWLKLMQHCKATIPTLPPPKRKNRWGWSITGGKECDLGRKNPRMPLPRRSFRCTILSRLFPCPLRTPGHLSQDHHLTPVTRPSDLVISQLATGHCPWPSSSLCCCCYCLVTKQVVSDSSATPWTEVCQASLSMGFPTGKRTGVGCHFLLQGIYPTERLNPCLQHWQVDSLPLSHLGST